MPYKTPVMVDSPALDIDERALIEAVLSRYLRDPETIDSAVEEVAEAVRGSRVLLAMGVNERPQDRGDTRRELATLATAARTLGLALDRLSEEARGRLARGPSFDNPEVENDHAHRRAAMGADFDWDAQENAARTCETVTMAVEWAQQRLDTEPRPQGRRIGGRSRPFSGRSRVFLGGIDRRVA
jgi:hypothetical protein